MRASLFVHKTSPYKPLIGLWIEEGLLNFTDAWTQYQSFEKTARRFPFQSWKEFLMFSLDARDEIGLGIEFLRSKGMLSQYLAITDDVKTLAPVDRTAKIVCLGRNYAAHARETGHEVPEEPMFFMKSIFPVVRAASWVAWSGMM